MHPSRDSLGTTMALRPLLKVMLAIFVFCIACSNGKKNQENAESSVAIYSDSIQLFFKSQGVATLISSDTNPKKNFEILNDDGTVYSKVDIEKDQLLIEGKSYPLSDFPNDGSLASTLNFFPKEFYPDYGVIQFEYLSIKNDLIEVFINKEKKQKKYLKNEGQFKIETWREHFTGSMIDFDRNKNLIRSDHSLESKSMNYEKTDADYIFVISEVSGEWIRIECSDICDYPCDDGKKFDGWIKWKDGDKLAIRLLYSC